MTNPSDDVLSHDWRPAGGVADSRCARCGMARQKARETGWGCADRTRAADPAAGNEGWLRTATLGLDPAFGVPVDYPDPAEPPSRSHALDTDRFAGGPT